LLIAGHRGIETELGDCDARCAEAASVEDLSISEDDTAGRPGDLTFGRTGRGSRGGAGHETNPENGSWKLRPPGGRVKEAAGTWDHVCITVQHPENLFIYNGMVDSVNQATTLV